MAFNLYCSSSQVREYFSHEKSISIGQTIKIISIRILIEDELIETFKFLLNLYIISSLEVFGGGKEKFISIGVSGGIWDFFNFKYCLLSLSNKSFILSSKSNLISFNFISFSLLSIFFYSLFCILFSISTFKDSSTNE